MLVKTFTAWTEAGLDKKVNEFSSKSNIEVVDVKFASPLVIYGAMIMYHDKKPTTSWY